MNYYNFHIFVDNFSFDFIRVTVGKAPSDLGKKT